MFTISPEHQDLITRISDTVTPEEEFAALLFFISHVQHQNVSTAVPNPSALEEPTTRFPSDTFKDFVRTNSARLIVSADRGSYTKTHIGQGKNTAPIRGSLQQDVMDLLKKQPAGWREKNCPEGFGVLGDGEAYEAVLKVVADLIKHTRGNFRTVLLTNILPYKGVQPVAPIPKKEEMVAQVRRSFEKLVSYDEAKAIYASTDGALRLRLRFARYITAHVYRNPDENKKKDQWNTIDNLLLELAQKSAAYRRVFFKLIMRREKTFFDGRKTYAELKTTTTFPIPTAEEVDAELAAERAQSPAPPPLSGAGDL